MVMGLIRDVVGAPLSHGRNNVGKGPEPKTLPSAGLLRTLAALPLACVRKREAVAAARVAAGYCADCGTLPIGEEGLCEGCWVEQHAGP